MQNFEYYVPTRVVFGKAAERETGRLVKDLGYQKALVHFGGGSVKNSGVLDRVYQALNAAGIQHVSLGGVVPNPRLSLVYEGVELCRRENVDFLLAVGGGSVVDSVKAIGYALANDGDVWDFYAGKRKPAACAPLGAVVTIAAAGSEMSDSSVISNAKIKRSFGSDLCRPKFAVMNPELTYSVTPYQTACGCVDIIAHVMERYFTNDTDTQLRDQLSEGLMRTVMHYARVLMLQPHDYNARAQIMWASSLAHNSLLGPRAVGDWACHQLEHELSGMFDVAHGAGIAAIWSSWARYVYQDNPVRFAQFGVNVLGIMQDFAQPEKAALAAIAAMEDWFRSIGMPASLEELGLSVTAEQVKALALSCSFDNQRTLGTFKKLTRPDMEEIYAAAAFKL